MLVLYLQHFILNEMVLVFTSRNMNTKLFYTTELYIQNEIYIFLKIKTNLNISKNLIKMFLLFTYKLFL